MDIRSDSHIHNAFVSEVRPSAEKVMSLLFKIGRSPLKYVTEYVAGSRRTTELPGNDDTIYFNIERANSHTTPR